MSIDLLTREDLPSARGGVWQYISPSRLNCWLACPLKFRFRYINGIRSPTTPALFLGKILHGCLETFYRHRQLGIALDVADLNRRLLESWGESMDEEAIQFDMPAEEQILQRQAGDLVEAYLGHVPCDEPRPLAVEAAVEMPLINPLTGEDFGIPLLGVMDLVLDGQAGPVIIDFKSSSRSSEPLEIVHEIQLTSYALLFRHVSDRQEAGLESGVGRGISPRPQPQTGRASFQASGFPDDSILFFPSRFCGRGNADTRSGCCPSRPPSQGWQSG